jgi:uncharacterized protein (UPF0332 family)
MLAAELPDEAGRMAYLAGFHAAQALIFERTGRTPKPHRGFRSQFGSLAITEAWITPSLRRFLTRGYDIKSLADYADWCGRRGARPRSHQCHRNRDPVCRAHCGATG